MADPEPLAAENCTNQYDDDELKPADPAAVIPWADALERLSTADTYWFATVHPSGRPHVRPVLAVWVHGVMVTTSSPGARKFRNIAVNDQVAFTTSTDGIHFIVEGTAAPVADADTLDLVAAAYHSKYGCRSLSPVTPSTRRTGRPPPDPRHTSRWPSYRARCTDSGPMSGSRRARRAGASRPLLASCQTWPPHDESRQTRAPRLAAREPTDSAVGAFGPTAERDGRPRQIVQPLTRRPGQPGRSFV